MVVYGWGPKYELGIKRIDDEHKILFDLLNDLQVAMIAGKSREALGNILQEIVKYAQQHFATEEQYLKEFHHPTYSSHKAQHDEFLGKIQEFQQQFEEGTVGLSIEVLNFLREWIENHLEKVDKEYVESFHKHGMK